MVRTHPGARRGVFGKSDPAWTRVGVLFTGTGVSHVCTHTRVPGFRVCAYNRKAVTRTRMVVTVDGCALAAASWLRGVQQARNRMTAAAAIPAGVCNSPAPTRQRSQPLGASLQLHAVVCQVFSRILAPSAIHLRKYIGLGRCPPWLPTVPGARVCCIGAYAACGPFGEYARWTLSHTRTWSAHLHAASAGPSAPQLDSARAGSCDILLQVVCRAARMHLVGGVEA
jgi:hypothetical protein